MHMAIASSARDTPKIMPTEGVGVGGSMCVCIKYPGKNWPFIVLCITCGDGVGIA